MLFPSLQKLGGLMQFDDLTLQAALVEWHSIRSANLRAESDNLWFETRVSDARRQAFEAEAAGAGDAPSLRRAHNDYWQTWIKTDADVPQTFATNLDPASYGPVDDMQKLVRIEAIDRPLAAHGIDFGQLRKAFDDNDHGVIDAFIRVWNTSTVRDSRPAFAAFKSEVIDDLSLPEWPARMRDRLGLAHYDCRSGPIPVALMEYDVRYVRSSAASLPGAAALTVPTALDSGPWPFFFPSPETLNCGRTMALYPVADDGDLLAEILHVRIAYRRANLIALGEIDRGPPTSDLRALRNHHLMALRLASGADHYGEEMPL